MNSDGNQPPSSPAPAAVGSSPNSRGSRATPSSTRPSSQPIVAATPPSSARRGILSSPNQASDNLTSPNSGAQFRISGQDLGPPSSSQGDNLGSLNASSPRTSDARIASQRTRSSDGGFNAAESAPATPSSQRSRGGRNDLRAGHRVNRPLEYSERQQPEENDGQGEQTIWGTTLVVRRVRDSIKDFFSNTTSHQAPNPTIREKYDSLIAEALETQPIVNLDCKDLMAVDQRLYQQLVLYPVEVIECFDMEACDIARQMVERGGMNMNLDVLRLAVDQIKVRPFNLRRLHVMRDLNPSDIDQLVSFRGMIIRAAPIIPDLQTAFFECNVCKNTAQVQLNKGRITEPSQCDVCRTQQSMVIIHNRCSFNDRQLVKCQESPGDIPQGETPHSVNLCAFDEMVDKAKPGDRVQVTGIYRAVPMRLKATQRSLRSVYKTYIDVIHYKKTEQGRLTAEEDGDGNMEDADNMRESTETAPMSLERQEEMRAISQSEDVVDLLVRSFAPSIVEMDDVKLGLLCQLFGGANKNYADSAMGKFRGELNVLLIGDPGTSKSQLLQYVHKVAPRGIYTSGKGSSAVGLTAYITRDPDTKEVVLDSGALVLSDRGICCIDEFDKMSENARSVLHEVMEQQTISIAKSGIICTLNARTSILAAANPVQSKYNPRLSVVENLNLPPSLLSRYLILDRVDPKSDRRLALHIVSMFYSQSSDPVLQAPAARVLSPAELSDYISFGRQKYTPELTDAAADKLVQGYMDMRSAGMSSKVIAATPRQLESLIRLAEALAKMRYSREVDEFDVDKAIWLMRVSTQKSATDPRTGQIDMDALSTGTTASSRGRAKDVLRNVRSFLQTQTRANVPLRDVLEMLRTTMPQENISDSDVRTAFSELHSEGFLVRVNQDNRSNESVRVIQNQGLRGAGDDD